MEQLRSIPERLATWRGLISRLLIVTSATLVFAASMLTLSLALSSGGDWTICALLFLVSGVLFEMAGVLKCDVGSAAGKDD
jgi:hypothetical protein